MDDGHENDSQPNYRPKPPRKRWTQQKQPPRTAAQMDEGRDCEYCHGSGLRIKRDIDGRTLGVIAGKACDHKPLPDEPPPLGFAGDADGVGW